MKKIGWMVTLAALGIAAHAANLLENPGFEWETGERDWSIQWGNACREAWNDPPEGGHAMYIGGSWRGQDNGGLIQAVPVEGGKQYLLKGLFYCDNNWKARDKMLKLEFLDSAGEVLKTYTDDLKGLKNERWVKRDIAGKAPENAVRAQVVVEASGVAADGVLGIDDLVLEPVGGPGR